MLDRLGVAVSVANYGPRRRINDPGRILRYIRRLEEGRHDLEEIMIPKQ